MAARKLPAGMTPWKPGYAPNPGGRPKLPEHLRAIKALTQDEVTRLISMYWRMKHTELITAKENPNISAGDAYIISLLERGIKTGEFMGLSFLLDRAIGKPQVIPEDPETAAARAALQMMQEAEVIKLLKEKLAQLEAPKGET